MSNALTKEQSLARSILSRLMGAPWPNGNCDKAMDFLTRMVDGKLTVRWPSLIRDPTCEKCQHLQELWSHTSKSDRDYWLMTELFVMLHAGSDTCRNSSLAVEVMKHG